MRLEVSHEIAQSRPRQNVPLLDAENEVDEDSKEDETNNNDRSVDLVCMQQTGQL